MPDGAVDLLRVYDDCNVKLRSFHATPATRAVPGEPVGASGYRYMTFRVSNLAEAVEAVRARGLAILREPYEIRPGVPLAFVEDPDGNAIELVQPS